MPTTVATTLATPSATTSASLAISAREAAALIGQFLVYPSHGVGRLTAVEVQDIAGQKIEMAVIAFAKDKMTVRVPTAKFASVGVRRLADAATVERVMVVLAGKPRRIQPVMWNRRAREYEAKLVSGDLSALAEVIRDLSIGQTRGAQSLYESALERMALELSAIDGSDMPAATRRIAAALALGRSKQA